MRISDRLLQEQPSWIVMRDAASRKFDRIFRSAFQVMRDRLEHPDPYESTNVQPPANVN